MNDVLIITYKEAGKIKLPAFVSFIILHTNDI